MNKIWSYIKKIFLSPLVPISLSIIFGCLIYYFFRADKDIIVNYILPCMGVGISVALVQCAFAQNKIQKDNIKIQLFDKRYSIYQSVLDSITIIKRDNWDRYILFYGNDINRQLIEIEENLYQSVQLSECLFDKELYAKLVVVNDAFCEVAKAYKDMLINTHKDMSEQQMKEFISLYKEQLVSENGLNSEEYKDKFPRTYINMLEFSKKCAAYITLIDNIEIIKSFHKYVTVNNLDK